MNCNSGKCSQNNQSSELNDEINNNNCFKILSPSEKKRQEMIQIAKKEEENYNKYMRDNTIKTFNEIHIIGGNATNYDVNIAREGLLSKVALSKHQKKLRVKQLHEDWKKKEEQEIEMHKAKQREKAELNEKQNKIYQSEMEEIIKKQRLKILQNFDSKSNKNIKNEFMLNETENNFNYEDEDADLPEILEQIRQLEVREAAQKQFLNKIDSQESTSSNYQLTTVNKQLTFENFDYEDEDADLPEILEQIRQLELREAAQKQILNKIDSQQTTTTNSITQTPTINKKLTFEEIKQKEKELENLEIERKKKEQREKVEILEKLQDEKMQEQMKIQREKLLKKFS